MASLTHEEYALTCALMKLGFEIHSGNEHLVCAAADAYAAAKGNNAANKSIQACAQFSCSIAAAKDAQISNLEKANKELADTLALNIETMRKRDDEQRAEIERLREGIRSVIGSLEFLGVGKGFKTEWHPSFEHSELKSLLSPANGR